MVNEQDSTTSLTAIPFRNTISDSVVYGKTQIFRAKRWCMLFAIELFKISMAFGRISFITLVVVYCNCVDDLNLSMLQPNIHG